LCVISIANVYVVILIYNLILSILTIEKDVLYNVYVLNVLYENNCEMFAILKILLSCETLHLKGNKISLIFIWKKIIDNKLSNY